MSQPNAAEPHVLDQPWRIWASVVVVGILLFGVVLGVLAIPVVQGWNAGLDAFSAICRALGILPGSPAQRQPFDRTPAAPVSQVVWTPDVLQVLARGDPARGRATAQEVCFACHGEQGLPVSADFPNLNGQSGAAIYKQLHDYRSGSRANEQMTPVAQALDEAIIPDVAAYYAGQPKRSPNPATLGELPAAIVRLVELGDPSRNIPPCAACHRPGAGGPIETPILTEQGYPYLVQQMQMYAAGQRRNDVYARMRTIAARLSESEIDGLARYYAAGFR